MRARWNADLGVGSLEDVLSLSARSALTSRHGSCSAWSRSRPTVCAVRPAGQASQVTSRRVGSDYLAARRYEWLDISLNLCR